MQVKKKISNIRKAFKEFSINISVVEGNKVVLWSDMLISRVLYGSKPDDYLFFEFYNLNFRERKTFLTHRKLKRLNKKLNPLATSEIFGENTHLIKFLKISLSVNGCIYRIVV